MKTLFKVAKFDLDPYYFQRYVQYPELLMGMDVGMKHSVLIPTKYRELIQQALVRKKIRKTFTLVWVKMDRGRWYV